MRSKQRASNLAYGLVCFDKMLIFIFSRFPVSLSPSKDDFNDIIIFIAITPCSVGAWARQEPLDWPCTFDPQCPPIYPRGAHPGDPAESDGGYYKDSIISIIVRMCMLSAQNGENGPPRVHTCMPVRDPAGEG